MLRAQKRLQIAALPSSIAAGVFETTALIHVSLAPDHRSSSCRARAMAWAMSRWPAASRQAVYMVSTSKNCGRVGLVPRGTATDMPSQVSLGRHVCETEALQAVAVPRLLHRDRPHAIRAAPPRAIHTQRHAWHPVLGEVAPNDPHAVGGRCVTHGRATDLRTHARSSVGHGKAFEKSFCNVCGDQCTHPCLLRSAHQPGVHLSFCLSIGSGPVCR